MSKLSELFGSVSQLLHHGPSTKPLWEQTIGEIDALTKKVADIETALSASAHALDPEMIKELQEDWARHKARLAERAPLPTAAPIVEEAGMSALELGAAVRAAGEEKLVDVEAHKDQEPAAGTAANDEGKPTEAAPSNT